MKSIRKFIKGIWLDVEKEAISLKQALFFQEDKEYDRSIKILDRIIKRNPKHAHAYYLRGEARHKRDRFLGEAEDALRDLEKAEELGSKSARSIIREIEDYREACMTRS